MKVKLLAVAVALSAAFMGMTASSADAQRVLPGYVAKQRVEKLSGEIHWYDNLSEALAEARRQDKLVFWVQMLGKIDGAT